ncbi:methyltransferase domain-containing protein [Candidatus Dojkabacteria bacterium]|nr:methyltransferase domain-containing protein [Candidatus Dojkabacteria bacterium]
MYPKIKLKKGKEYILSTRHPWIFDKAIRTPPTDLQNGSVVYLTDSEDQIVATGTYSPYSMIKLRIFEFKEQSLDQDWWIQKINDLKNFRQNLGYPSKETNAYRLAFGESDGTPGLIIDIYNDIIVFQSSTAGIDLMKEDILNALLEIYKPKAIVERSDISIRRREKIEETKTIHYGEIPDLTIIKENDIDFYVDIINGQKTGFFLDQKLLRQQILNFSKDLKILNLFSYSGASGIYALKGGAKTVHNIDISSQALELAKRNASLNNIDNTKFSIQKIDVFEWLDTNPQDSYDMIIIDPPAFIKTHKAKARGIKAYHFVNKACLELLNHKGIFATSSCSHYLKQQEFYDILKKASIQQNLTLKTLRNIIQAPDHPISVYFPEGSYLKSMIAQVF